jgi:hypothetical protein
MHGIEQLQQQLPNSFIRDTNQQPGEENVLTLDNPFEDAGLQVYVYADDPLSFCVEPRHC